MFLFPILLFLERFLKSYLHKAAAQHGFFPRVSFMFSSSIVITDRDGNPSAQWEGRAGRPMSCKNDVKMKVRKYSAF